MTPIRVAIIGLSGTAKTSWAAEGHLPYLLSPRDRAKYTLTALCNSSVSAAQAAIKYLDLPASTKAYGSPEDIAADEEIDLVVITTRVDVHYDTVAPSIRAGKKVFVEWPLTEIVRRVDDLVSLAQENVNAAAGIVGLQGKYSPVAIKAKELLEAGVVGKVASSDVMALRAVFARHSLPESLAYFVDEKVGGNLVTIAFAHSESLTPRRST